MMIAIMTKSSISLFGVLPSEFVAILQIPNNRESDPNCCQFHLSITGASNHTGCQTRQHEHQFIARVLTLVRCILVSTEEHLDGWFLLFVPLPDSNSMWISSSSQTRSGQVGKDTRRMPCVCLLAFPKTTVAQLTLHLICILRLSYY